MDTRLTTSEKMLIGPLVGLARATESNPKVSAETYRIIVEVLVVAKNSDNTAEIVQIVIDRIHTEKNRLAPDCSICSSPCGRTADYPIDELLLEEETVRNLKIRLLYKIEELAINAFSLFDNGNADISIGMLLLESLFRLGYRDTEENLKNAISYIEDENNRIKSMQT